VFRSYAGAPDFHQMTLIQQEQEEASVLMKEDHKEKDSPCSMLRLKGTVCVILFLQSKFKAAFL